MIVSNNNNLLISINFNISALTSNRLILINRLIFVLLQIEQKSFFQRQSNKNSTFERRPLNVNQRRPHIKAQLGIFFVNVPDLNSPISRCGNKSLRIEGIKLHSINSQRMSFKSHLILTIICSTTEMYISFFCSDNELKFVEGRKVKAKPRAQLRQRFFFLFFINKFQSINFFALQNVFHEHPIENSAVRRD